MGPGASRSWPHSSSLHWGPEQLCEGHLRASGAPGATRGLSALRRVAGEATPLLRECPGAADPQPAGVDSRHLLSWFWRPVV